MELNINNLVRSAAIVVIGLPLTLPLGGAIMSAIGRTETAADRAVTKFKDELTVPCLKYVFSKSDSKAERNAKNAIDEVVGGEVNYGAVCKYVL